MIEIKIQNHLPKGIETEVLREDTAIRTMLEETGFDVMARKFFESLLEEMKAAPLATWIRWEGYFHDLGETQNVLVVGAFFMSHRIHVRAMLAKAVPNALVNETEAALATMMNEYLNQLRQGKEKDQAAN
jgi:hypothetical protein